MNLEINNISKSFEEKNVLNNINFQINPGEIAGVVGRNGSGKTTLLKIISKIIDPNSGTIKVDGVDIFENPKLIENISYLPDVFHFFKYDTPKKAMEYYQLIYPKFDKEFAQREIKKMNIPIDKQIRTLSKGNKTILGLIITLATKSQYILVDEVLDGIDVLNKEIIINYLLDAKEEKRSILIASHQLQEIQNITDNVFYLSLNGKMENVTNNHEDNFQKVQVVVRESLPTNLEKDSLIRSHIGRVYILLLKGSEEEVIKKLIREEIIQFDILPLQLEDYFYWEKGGEFNERSN